ncbi:MAG: TrmJ/YjtD family RNA methyltransferase [Candidatus Electryonea clarkiae]|nr:TrmJ/YjtD family RNA methyltransferase [Candidatus Electryonea clarkiae]MDP8289093.1 TrmJ/YjtD family RNA methyltransferase [Candidatus Electryonea clarkiae]
MRFKRIAHNGSFRYHQSSSRPKGKSNQLHKTNDSGPPNPDELWQFASDNRLRNVALVLIEPARPENVGAAARAMKTMGLERLIIVGTSIWRSGKARALAVGAGDILEAVEEYATLAEAVAGMKAVAVTTARRRRRARPVFPVDSAVPHLLGVAEHGNVAVVFGREEWGMTQSELLLGDWWVTIPMANAYPSLNLAQSVMLVCNEISNASRRPMPQYPWVPADHKSRHLLMENAAKTLIEAGFQPKPDIDGFLLALSRVFDRALLEERDVKVIHGVFHQVELLNKRMKRYKSQKDQE